MNQQPLILLHGNGSELSNRKSVQRRAKCKLITQKTMLALIDAAKKWDAKDKVKGYWNSCHCQNRILTTENKMYAPLCRNRFCTPDD
jgi:hypothetical protein